MGQGLMARKNLLEGLLNPPAGASGQQASAGAELPPAASPAFTSIAARGAIGAVSRSIEQIKAQSIVDLDPGLVDPSLISDRLEHSTEAHAELVASIREHGQQVPILVRPHPEKAGRYQIAYGRRRLRAVAELGRKIRAVVRSLTDQELVVAQGQENSARTDLSFIEKALFAARLEDSGYGREIIMAALSVDKTGLSRLISSAVKIPQDLIEAIGPAPKAGRDRWVALSARLSETGALSKARASTKAEAFAATDTDERFNRVFAAVAPALKETVRPTTQKAADGTAIAQVKEDQRSFTIAIDKKASGEFGTYLVERLPELYAAFKDRASRD
jgi:ParB family transcriptional regulator, chromosome partitioning protein